MNRSPPKKMRIEELIRRNIWEVDKERHIEILDEKSLPKKQLLLLCPMRCYVEEEGRLVMHYEECVECGLCRILSNPKSLRWDLPRGGMGIRYRYG